MNIVMSDNQFDIVVSLARAFGHEWAWNIPDEARGVWSTERIRENTLSHRENGSIPGIDCPQADDDGIVGHTTGTGRTEWAVHPNGRVEVVINRPNTEVFRAKITTDGVVRIHVLEEVFFERHVEALEAVIYPAWHAGYDFLEDHLDEVFAPLRAAALPDPGWDGVDPLYLPRGKYFIVQNGDDRTFAPSAVVAAKAVLLLRKEPRLAAYAAVMIALEE
jgi:hypothetical protein